MNKKLISFLILVTGPLLVFVFSKDSLADEEGRPFTVRDSVEMSYFGTVFNSNPRLSHDDGVVSPDGRFFVKMTHRGVLPDGVTEGTIWLFDAADVMQSVNNPKANLPLPTELVRMSATINGLTADFYERGNILFQLMWSEDSRYLYFLGRDGRENRQLFRVEILSGELEALSLEDQDVMTYTHSADAIAYLAGPNVNEQEAWVSAGPGIPDIVVGTGTPLLPLLYPNFRGYDTTKPLVLEAWQVREHTLEPLIDKNTGAPLQITTRHSEVAASASSDGTHKLLTDELFDEYGWSSSSSRKLENTSNLRLSISEALNEQPVLVATDSVTGQSRTIFDPNPQLAGIEMASVSAYEWQDSHGRKNHGLLVTPPGFDSARRYPLVIQTHGFNAYRFFRVGYSDTANAGRALVSRGIVVLQVQEQYSKEEQPWKDLAKTGLDVYLGAIDQLSESGIINPEKVGITGYSESGLLSVASLTKAPDRFAAAFIANSDPLTITGYYSYVDSPLHGVTAALLGAAPYGEGLSDWIERSPSMSTEKIQAPILISATDPWHLLSLWDLYAALRYQGKPVELQYIRTGRHNIKKPLHKIAHQEMLVDWFDFWLNDSEDVDPDKAGQYKRWQGLRGVADER